MYARGVPGVNRFSKAVDLLMTQQTGDGRDFGRRKVPVLSTETS